MSFVSTDDPEAERGLRLVRKTPPSGLAYVASVGKPVAAGS
jgi:hypothetical protein